MAEKPDIEESVRVRQESASDSPLDELNGSNKCHFCMLYGKSSIANYHCNECAQYLCKSCKKSHKKKQTTKKHHLAQVFNEQCGKSLPNKKQMERKETEKTKIPFLGSFFSRKPPQQRTNETDKIKKSNSPASKLLRNSVLKEKGNPSPSKFALAMTEIKEARNEQAKTKKFEIGKNFTIFHICFFSKKNFNFI
jgi:glutamate synthase domain-containing protein 2